MSLQCSTLTVLVAMAAVGGLAVARGAAHQQGGPRGPSPSTPTPLPQQQQQQARPEWPQHSQAPQGPQGPQGASQPAFSLVPAVCTTPLNRDGLCIPLQSCKPLLALLHASRAKPGPGSSRSSGSGPVSARGLPDAEITLLLRMSHCGFQGNTVMVCCPPDETKDSESRTKPESSTRPPSPASEQAAPGGVYPLSTDGAAIQPLQGGPEAAAGLPGWPEHHNVGDPKENLALLPTELCGLQAARPKHAPSHVPANTTAPMQYPWMARVGYRLGETVEYLCTGSLISERYVLTAAHCAAVHNGPVTVRLGDRDVVSDPDCEDSLCAPGVVDVDVEDTVIQDGHQDRLNDLALLRLARPVMFTDAVGPICLPVPVSNRPEDTTGKQMVVAAWGNTSPNKRQNAPSRWLLHFRASVAGPSSCHAAYDEVDDVRFSPERHLCVNSGCYGDSGSPLMLTAAGDDQQGLHRLQRVVLHGVLSYGLPDCALRGVPVVYARVSRALPWILRNLKPNPFVPKDKTSGSSQMDPRLAATGTSTSRKAARIPVSHL